mmetsp:Transcript_2055/g.2939  ORF Transcript_2055/g.2939 Transcript_2055/m.2939 type:complete len:121 (-) Transcript_2055:104-466(-)
MSFAQQNYNIYMQERRMIGTPAETINPLQALVASSWEVWNIESAFCRRQGQSSTVNDTNCVRASLVIIDAMVLKLMYRARPKKERMSMVTVSNSASLRGGTRAEPSMNAVISTSILAALR